MEYVSGTKDTGVIVKDKNTGIQLMWIPYDENVTAESANDYYQNCDYQEMDIDTQESIIHYGGFYVILDNQNQFDTLKNVDNNSYQIASKNAQNMFEDSDSVNSHLLYKFEVAQIEAYGQKIGKDLIKTGSKTTNSNKSLNLLKVVETTTTDDTQSQVTTTQESTTQEESSGESTTDEENAGVVAVNPDTYEESEETGTYKIEYTVENNVEEVPIPDGFEYFTYEGTIFNPNRKVSDIVKYDTSIAVKIQDETNPNLRYVWVPVDDLESCSTLIKQQYDEQNQNFYYDSYQSVENDTYKQLLESVEKYGGFYIAESELGTDDNKNPINIARGMKVNDESGYTQVNVGDYYRGTNFNTYEEAVKIASNLHTQNKNVVSHLMYGTEYDATLLWLYSTGTVTAEQLIKDSSAVPGAKYSGTYEDKELLDDDLHGLNGIYGLAGNLSELTQELVEYSEDGEAKSTWIVARGGSYANPGNQFSMASRITLNNETVKQGQDVGIRNCLFINPDVVESEKYFEITKEGEVRLNEEYLTNAKQLPETLEIPSTIGGVTVKSIGSEGFKGCTSLKNIVLPETLEEIEAEAFADCTNLVEITYKSQDSLKKIRRNAFENCKALTSITIPKGVIAIYGNVFGGCDNLTAITFQGDTLPEMENTLFANINSLKTIYISNKVPDAQKKKLTSLIGNDKIEIITITGYSILDTQINNINSYKDGYVYGSISEDVSKVKEETKQELTSYYNNNNKNSTEKELENKLTEIRQAGEQKIEKLMSDYRDKVYNNQVENYINQYHSDISSEEWVITLKNDTKNKIQSEVNMDNVDKIAIDFQVQLENTIKPVEQYKAQIIEQIISYVPYVGEEGSEYWKDGVNDIKSKYISQVTNAQSEDEAIKLKSACEQEIEEYVAKAMQEKTEGTENSGDTEEVIEDYKQEVIDQINAYVPYVGEEGSEYWSTGVNDIKSKYVELVKNAINEEAALAYKQACENEIEDYVGQIMRD